METLLAQLILEEDEVPSTLVFALGSVAREYFEKELISSLGTMSSVRAMLNSRDHINVLFLNKLQYLYMYLTKFEVEEGEGRVTFKNLVIYGLDDSLGLKDEHLSVEQTRLANLIYNVAFKVKARYQVEVQFIPCRAGPCDDLNRLEQYWREIC
ncbi:LANO_0D05886g1_1 [Lachancea nothofagi CBS 11611]|uniref:LANO_0D05886g1_1 n=1 Tax=Lachancea nothofagi CBS 11611 TaxID=1266666 RepID=A0A1G4JH91_9SACH|nr:LANO_0D05886g1_1 [Lachancea nothofagi CBS 11611]